MKIITHERLLERVEYDADSGLFIHRQHRCSTLIGRVAGSITKTGYIEIQIDGMRFLAHRLAWFYVKMVWPMHVIDHIDGDGTNNVFSNLREARQGENARNKRIQSNNKTGYQGVVYDTKRGKWRAYANVNGKHFHGGRFDNLEDAIRARRELSLRVHGEFSPEFRHTGDR